MRCPTIETVPAPYVKDRVEVAAWMLQPGEAQLVARRMREELTRDRR